MAALGRLGAILGLRGVVWGPLGPVLGPLGARRPRPGTPLGPSWGRLGAVLGPFGGHFGPSWGHLGTLLSMLKLNFLQSAENLVKYDVFCASQGRTGGPRSRKPRILRGFLNNAKLNFLDFC